MPRLLSVAPAMPAHVYAQEEITATLGPLLTEDRSALSLLGRVHRNAGVRTRHLALPLEEYADLGDFGAANDRFVALGTDLAARAVTAALDEAGITAADVDFLLFTSVTGISAPSVDALLVERLGFRTDVKRLPSFGLGCVGGAAGLARVSDYLAGHPDDVALLVTLELCSLTLQRGDDSPASLVSSGLFGDGAAAAVVVGDRHPHAETRVPQVVATRSRLYLGTDDHLGWAIGASGFRIVLSSAVPDVIEAHLRDDVEALLAAHDLVVDDVAAWVVHAGGPRIVGAVERALTLPPAALDATRESLAAVGNLSSASVLHVLSVIGLAAPPAGSVGVMVAFGPGISAELVLLRWPDGGTPC